MNKREVEFEGVNYIVRKPNAKDIKDAKLYSNIVFGELVEKGVKTKAFLDALIVNEKRDEKIREDREVLQEILNKLARGGYSKLEARKDAIKAYETRMSILQEMASGEYSRTADAQADEASQEYLFHKCLLKEDGSQVYASSLQYADEASTKLAEFLVEQYQELMGESFSFDSCEEIAFLKKYGYMNDEYQLINEAGEIVDEDFNVVPQEEFTEFTDD